MARRTAGSAALVLVDGAIELHPEPALFEAMIEGWRRQHTARRLSPAITVARVRVLRRFQEFSGAWPWQWRSEQLEVSPAELIEPVRVAATPAGPKTTTKATATAVSDLRPRRARVVSGPKR